MSTATVMLINILTVPVAYGFLSDVSPSHANGTAIKYLFDNNIVSGYPDGTYRPYQEINRAEFAKILEESIPDAPNGVGICPPSPESYNGFSDVHDEWFWIYICMQQGRGIVSGYPDNTFRPGNSITFVEAAKMLYGANHLDDRGILTTAPAAGEPWYRPYVTYLAEQQAIPMTITRFDRAISRGEMAEMMYRLHAKITTKASLTYEQINQMQNPPAYLDDRTTNTTGFTRYDGAGFSINYPSGWQVHMRRTDMSFGVDFFPGDITFPPSWYASIDLASVPELISIEFFPIGSIENKTYDSSALELEGGTALTIDGKTAQTATKVTEDGLTKATVFTVLATPPLAPSDDGNYGLDDMYVGAVVNYRATPALYRDDIARELQTSFHEDFATLGALNKEEQDALALQQFYDLYGTMQPQYLTSSLHDPKYTVSSEFMDYTYQCANDDLSNPPMRISLHPVSQIRTKNEGPDDYEKLYQQGSPGVTMERITVNGVPGVYAPWSDKPGVVVFWKDGFRVTVGSYFCDITKEELLKIADSMKLIKPAIHQSTQVPPKE